MLQDIIVNGEMLRVRPRRPESVTSTASMESGLSRGSSFAFDEGPGQDDDPDKDVGDAGKEKTPSVVTPKIVFPTDQGSTASGSEFAMRTVEHSPEPAGEGEVNPADQGAEALPKAPGDAGGSDDGGSEQADDDAPAAGESSGTKRAPGKVVVTDDEIRAQLEVSDISYVIFFERIHVFQLRLRMSRSSTLSTRSCRRTTSLCRKHSTMSRNPSRMSRHFASWPSS